MSYNGYKAFKFRSDGAILFVTIDYPPINLMTIEMSMEIARLAQEVAEDDAIKVIVFDSANPDYFIAHFDVTVLSQFPDVPPPRAKTLDDGKQAMELFRTMPKVSIAKLEGRARGGGSEFVLSLDMRFGAIGKAILCQPEIAVGIIPGGGGTQQLPRLMGRSRALEVVLGAKDFTAEVAERYGYINRALPPDELGGFVEDLAYRIASFPAESIALNKQSVLNAEEMPLTEGLIEESYLFGKSAALPASKHRMTTALDVGIQTYEKELDFDILVEELDQALRRNRKG
jgi:enoyl-CoA hydratase/carnithine racemase